VYANNGSGLIDVDLEPNHGQDFIGVPDPTKSQAAFNTFLSTLGPNADIGIEDFESFDAVNPFGVSGAPVDLDLTFDRIPPATGSLSVTADLMGTGLVANLNKPATVMGAPMNPDNESGRFAVTVPVGGEQYFSTNFDSLAFTITFSEPVSAFGFFGTDFGDFNGQTELVINGDALNPIVMPHPRTSPPTMDSDGNIIENELNASLLFYGLVGLDGMTISSVAFRNQGGIYDRFGFDNLVVAQVSDVPEPASMTLLFSGLLVGGLVQRRRSRRARRAAMS
jgi:hypothetical protein